MPFATAVRPVGAFGGTTSCGPVIASVAPFASCPRFVIETPAIGSVNVCPTSIAASLQSPGVAGCMSISSVSGSLAVWRGGASVRISTPCSAGAWLS